MNAEITGAAIDKKPSANKSNQERTRARDGVCLFMRSSGLTKKAEPPPTRGVNRDSGTAMTNGGWLRRLVRLLV
jgi:hypothetical protein